MPAGPGLNLVQLPVSAAPVASASSHMTDNGSSHFAIAYEMEEREMKKILLATALVFGVLGGVSAASATPGDSIDYYDNFDNFFEWVADNR